MNVEIETEAVQFPEKEYIDGILVAVYAKDSILSKHHFKIQNGTQTENEWIFVMDRPQIYPVTIWFVYASDAEMAAIFGCMYNSKRLYGASYFRVN